MSRRLAAFLGVVMAALIWPVTILADHIFTSATVTAQLKERRGADTWTVEIRWTADCRGMAPGTAWYDGRLYMIDADTLERIYVGDVVDVSGQSAVSRTREWSVSSTVRGRRLYPELTIHCYQNFPLHGGSEVLVTGAGVLVPPRFSGGGTGGGAGGPNGDYGTGDPTRPPVAGGCVQALVGTGEPDTLVGDAGGDVIFGLAAGDRIRGRDGHDCLIGGSGNDVLRGEAGADRLTGGRGDDTLIGGPGVNAYDAGPGSDFVHARNGQRELVRCGSGRDRARVDRNDRVVSCERVSRPR